MVDRWRQAMSSLSDLGLAGMEALERQQERQSQQKLRARQMDLEAQRLEAELKRLQMPHIQGGYIIYPDGRIEMAPPHLTPQLQQLQAAHQEGWINDDDYEKAFNAALMAPATKEQAELEREKLAGQREQRMESSAERRESLAEQREAREAKAQQERLGIERQGLGLRQQEFGLQKQKFQLAEKRYQDALKAPGGKAGSTEFERNLAWLKHNDPDFTDEKEQEMRQQRLLKQEGQSESLTMQFQGGPTPSQETVRRTGPAAGKYQQDFTEAMQAFSALQGPGLISGRGNAPLEEQALALVEQQQDPSTKKAWAEAYRRRFPKGKPVGKAQAAPKISEEPLAPEAPKAAPPPSRGKVLDDAAKKRIWDASGHNIQRAEEIARSEGYTW